MVSLFRRDIESDGILKVIKCGTEQITIKYLRRMHLVNWFCERERCQRLRSRPEKAREGRECNLFWLISRLQAPTEGEVSA